MGSGGKRRTGARAEKVMLASKIEYWKAQEHETANKVIQKEVAMKAVKRKIMEWDKKFESFGAEKGVMLWASEEMVQRSGFTRHPPFEEKKFLVESMVNEFIDNAIHLKLI